MANQLLMRKGDFLISGYSEYVLSKGEHVAVTFEQAKFVSENPKVNGPKVLLFLLNSNNMPTEVIDAGWKDLIRREQALQDKGAPAYVEKTAEVEKPAAEPVVEVTADGAKAIDALRAHLETFTDKAELIKYVGTLDVKCDVKGNWGLERIVAAVMQALEAKQTA